MRHHNDDSDEPCFRCPFCRYRGAPVVSSKITTGGWIAFWVLLLSLVGALFCWVGLLMREEVRSCAACRVRLG